MEQNVIIRKIASARINRITRDGRAYNGYYEKIRLAGRLLAKIEKSTHDVNLIQEARKQYVGAYITAIEVYFKDILFSFLKVAGTEKFNESFERKDGETIRLMLELNVTPEDAIVSNYNMQNLKEIDKVFRKFDVLLFEDLKKLVVKDYLSKLVKFYEEKDFDSIVLPDNFYVKVDEFIQLRHDFTHDINFKKKIKKSDLDEYALIVVLFILAADNLFERKLSETSRKIKNNA